MKLPDIIFFFVCPEALGRYAIVAKNFVFSAAADRWGD
jgi:hypothetical protein